MKTLFIIPGACSFGAMFALELLNQPYKIGITTKEIRQTPQFRAINPVGKVAALQDENNLIYENLAILFYLADKNPDSKIGLPLNSKDRIDAYKWLSYIVSTLHVAFGPLFNPSAFADEKCAESVKLKVIERLRDILAFMNEYLLDKHYFVGDKLTIVDGHAYGILRWTTKLDLLKDYPAINLFMTRMGELPAVQNVLNIEQQQPVSNSSFAGYYTF